MEVIALVIITYVLGIPEAKIVSIHPTGQHCQAALPDVNVAPGSLAMCVRVIPGVMA